MEPLKPSSYARLYEEAEVQAPEKSLNPTEEICPLYHALKGIDIRYGEETPISTGGMKEVFKVYDTRAERYVALARPKADMPIERYDAFLREAHITARLEHPNIIKLFDMGIDDQERPFFTMAFKRGLSLRAILKEVKKGKAAEEYPLERRYSIFLRVCEAMSYAHSRHVLHLDLKPENIQTGTFGEVQICDWGLGEIERGESEEHITEALLDPDLYGDQLPEPAQGTPGYMAPEQANPRSIKTVQSDIFSLGCLLYELSTLKGPNRREKTQPESPAIAAIVGKACASDPKERYTDVESLRADVFRHVLGFSPNVEKAGFIRECRLFYRRNRQPCLLTLGFTSLLLGAGIWFNAELSASYHTTSEALKRTKSALIETQEAKIQATIQQGMAESARDRAELLLTKFTQEQEYSSALLQSHSRNAFQGSELLLDFLIMNESITMTTIESAMDQVDAALANNPPAGDPLWTQKAYALFLSQRFEEADKYFKIRAGQFADLKAMTPEYSTKIGPNDILPVDEFVALIDSLYYRKQDRAPLMEKMVIYDSLKRESIQEQADIVFAVLKVSNIEWESPQFNYDDANNRLSISGNGLRKLIRPKVPDEGSPYPSRSILRFLNLLSLDISHSDVYDLTHLDGLNLQYLDLRDTKVTDLTPLNSMISLREVIIEPEQFSDETLAKVSRFIKVTPLPL